MTLISLPYRPLRLSVIPLLLAAVLIAAACGSSEPEATEPAAASTAAPTTQPPTAAGEAEFAITAVAFGEDGFVEITNLGGSAGSLDGFFLCQRPSYHGISGIGIAPGESARIMAGASSFGSLNATSGEIGLYRNSSFGDSSAIISYVEWGGSGHGRSSVAVEANVWTDGGFVDTSGGPGGIEGDGSPTPGAWRTAP